ncbi:MAG: hypothetical protein ACFFAS_02600 [Promethearchaeota archaeon]
MTVEAFPIAFPIMCDRWILRPPLLYRLLLLLPVATGTASLFAFFCIDIIFTGSPSYQGQPTKSKPSRKQEKMKGPIVILALLIFIVTMFFDPGHPTIFSLLISDHFFV